MPPQRPNIYVVARFLDALHQEGRQYTRNQLQMAVRLNYDLYRSYLAFMEEREYLEWVERNGDSVARVTAAGREAYQKIIGILQEWLGEAPF